MTAFTVICETCGAKLKVRDHSLVGEIHACPKCTAMVLIAPATAAVAAPAIVISPTDIPQLPAADFGFDMAALDRQSTGPPPDESAAINPPTVATETAPLPFAASAADRVVVAIWCAAAVGALSIVAGLTYAMWPANDKAAANSPVTPATATAPAAEIVEVAPAETVEPAQPVAETSQPDSQPATNVATVDELPPLPEPAPVATPVAVVAAPAEESVADPVPEPSTPVLVLDPLEIDPTELDLALAPRKLTPPVPQPTEADAADTAANVDATETLTPVEMDATFAPGTAKRVDASSVDPGDLTTKLGRVQMTDTPLAIAVDFVARAGNIPIGLDPRMIDFAALSPRRPVTLALADATPKTLSEAIAKAIGLTVEQQGTSLRITKADLEKPRSVDYRVDDLATADQLPELAARLRKLVAPSTWTAEAMRVEGTSLRIAAPLATHYELLLLCERLRMARGLPLRSKYPAERLTIEPRLTALERLLSRPLTVSFVEPRPIADLFAALQATGDLSLLVDWPALADTDTYPATAVRASCDALPLAGALDAFLPPLGLVWVPLTGDTLVVTTPAAAESLTWVEFYPLPAEAAQAATAAELQAEFVEYDPPSKAWIVRGGLAAHRAAIEWMHESR